MRFHNKFYESTSIAKSISIEEIFRVFFDKKEQETVTKKVISDRNEITESDIESAYASLKIS